MIEVLSGIDVKCEERDIQAAHILNKRGTVIVKLSRKCAYQAIKNRMKLRDDDDDCEAEGRDKLYINQSLCPAYGLFMYLIRRAWREDKRIGFWLAGDTIKVKMTPSSEPENVQHINDLVKLGIATEEDVEKFYSP